MAIAFVKKTPNSTTPKGATGNTVVNDAFASTVSVGNIVIAVCSQYRSGGNIPGTVTFSDDDSNTWYIDKHEVIGYRGITVGHCYPKSAVALTITATCVDTNYCDIAAAEFSGVALGLTAGGSANNSSNGNSTQPTTNLIDVGTGNYLFIPALMWNGVVNQYLSSPWTMMHNDGSDVYANLDWNYYITSGDQTANWNYAPPYTTWASAGVAYAEAKAESIGYDLATITNPSSGLIDFSLLINLANCSSSFKSNWNTNSNGYGRAFKTDGTELACDWIDLNYAYGSGLVRVKWSGTLNNSGTQQLKLYPPNTANMQYSSGSLYGWYNAYDSYWKIYYPTPKGGVDRTSNQVTLIESGTITTAIGKIGTAASFPNATNNYVYANQTTITDVPITLISWVRFSSTSGNTRPINLATAINSYDNNVIQLTKINGGTLGFVKRRYSTVSAEPAGTLSNNTWHFFAGKEDSSNNRSAWRDTTKGDNSSVENNPLGIDTLIIGQTDDTLSTCLLNEIQLHSTNRSDDWISEEYAQTNNNSTFWGTWTWQSGVGVPICFFWAG